MGDYDDCPHVDEREAEEIEADTRMSVADYERKLDQVQDTPIRVRLRNWQGMSGGNVRRATPKGGSPAVMRSVGHVGAKPRPRASEKTVEVVSDGVRERYRQQPPFDGGDAA